MDDEGQSGLDSPTLQSNPGTPLPAHQMSHPSCWSKFDTKLSADSVEWCPIPSRRELLVCGTYELTKGQVEQRVGNLHLLRCANNHSLEIIQKIDVPAVLDSKWCPHELNNQVMLGTTDAQGRLQLYGLKEEHIIDITSQTVEGSCIALSLDWSNVKYHSQQPLIAVSDSKGRLSIYHLNQQELCLRDHWTAHEHEAWVVAFDYWMPDVVYSGGDDCKLKVWDLRQSARTPTFTSRQHSMGVTSIQNNRWNCNMIASGSYDERIYLWDVRKMHCPNSVVESGGGVWRLKWHPQTGRHLLAACMHGGAVIVDCHPFQTIKLWSTYREHVSMVYGVDWQVPPSSLSDQETVASCSFYDHSLHLWTCSLKNQTTQSIETST